MQHTATMRQSIKDASTKCYHRFVKNVITVIVIVVLTFDAGPRHNAASAEYFSSIDSLRKLGDVELGLVQVFRDYLAMQEKEFASYTRFIENVKAQHRIAIEDPEDYLGNPINAFTLIKRMVTDWNYLHGFIKDSQALSAFRQMLDDFHQTQQVPDDSELKGAVMGLARLQKVYNLHAHELAKGKINGVYYGTELSWNDCFEIATNLYDQKELSLALSWFEMTLEKLHKIDKAKKDAIQQRFELETLEYLALVNYELGGSDKAVEYFDELLELAPNHHAKDMRTYILNTSPKPKPTKQKDNPFDWYKNYTTLCQGQQLPEKRFHNLKCKIERRNKPSFILAPLKIEQLSLDPEMNLYHNLLNDVQINRIIAEAEDKLVRSQVKSSTGGTASDVRVSQQAWLNYTSPIMRTVRNLVSDVTGFDLKNAEFMQMANYGIGGQYEPHNDFFGPGGFTNDIWIGDRIATNMFYLSDVEQGGYTVFPRINIISRPVKGALIVWHNLHRSLEPDFRTLHAGCPVVKGSKRIGNIWVHSGYQEFNRPCGLKDDAFESISYQNKKQAEAAKLHRMAEEANKKVEPAKKAEPVKKAEPAKEAQPAQKAEHSKKVEPAKKAEAAKEAEPAKKAKAPKVQAPTKKNPPANNLKKSNNK